ncbi:response regulator transcription factor [Cohnella silvisoli]|uniref:Response regulator transcription factor n=1 Tax=Cohnella silvisoli TaxID=2873699 RepID=A0ABV1L4A4_9BACL|nr:response regulator transcription factor [Cohnella silvisoli]MCD9026439.1 response regulator transcription factor [Cohnella silvisoli]
MTATILTVDDDIQLQEILHLFLTAAGFHVLQAFNGEQCLAHLERKQPDLILLDIQMPDTDGITLCRRIRSLFQRPILFLTGNTQMEDKLNSLQSGGDDYITKPFDSLELIARVKAHLRWGMLLAETREPRRKLSVPGLEIDLERLTVIANGQPVTLLAKEMHLLLTLAQNQQRVYHPRQLYELIWIDPVGYSSDIIKVHIHRLRKKIEVDPMKPKFIHTVNGFGYKFEPSE